MELFEPRLRQKSRAREYAWIVLVAAFLVASQFALIIGFHGTDGLSGRHSVAPISARLVTDSTPIIGWTNNTPYAIAEAAGSFYPSNALYLAGLNPGSSTTQPAYIRAQVWE